MAIWIQEHWVIALIAVVVLAALVIWFWSRSADSGAEPAIAPEAARAPLAPAKPEIISAEPARFAKVEPVAAPAPAPAPVPAAAPPLSTGGSAGADNLALLKGVGPKLVALLDTLGVSRFDQIAAWSDADIAMIDEQLGNFKGRIERDNWVDQAGYLVQGDKAGFEAKYGALGGEL